MEELNFLTTGDIATKLDVDRDVVNYALRKAKVKPIGMAGIVRLFPTSALDTVKSFLDFKKIRKGEK